MWLSAQVSKKRNQSLDGIRAVAVILTFNVHFFGGYLATFRGANPNSVPLASLPSLFDKILYWLYHSHHGVSIFFILSGFLISKISQSADCVYLTFIRNRIVRVYPAFLLALVICLAGGASIGAQFPDIQTLIGNLVFLNAIPSLGIPGIVFNNVTWSLFYEMVFYLLFPVVLLIGRWAGLPAIASTIVGGLIFAYGPLQFGMDLRSFIFLFVGAGVGCLSREQIERVANICPDVAIVSIYLLTTTLFTLGYIIDWQFTWLFSGLSIIVLCKAVSKRGALARALSWRPLAWLGMISYSFYLLHSVAIVIAFRARRYFVVSDAGDVVPLVILAALSFAGAVLLALISYLIVERFYFAKRAPVSHEAPSSAVLASDPARVSSGRTE
ncbi:acyltransferase family protein [Bradyrhizobium cajani]|uniref:Acyltransferase family protein n=1 Tax=Bradyrhizobium cajani TaxID=1928661 RepID=A0A844T1T8_9BRAD|nr:acyltransferase [Bradyrhizobium cajani]MCP3370981.1 acyltransferase [Bradyrhizobium cajani]MVT71565.1 acyltransferase family protein [Bradyrhizobium cajani]